MTENYIVFFDSGVGGVTVLRECVKRYPTEKYLYYGDNENAPYGNRPREEIIKLAKKAFEEIACVRVRAVVIACNTVTAECVDALRKIYSFPIVGIEPAIKPAALCGGKVLLLATRATLESERVKRLIATNESNAEITVYSPENLAGDVERNIENLDNIRLSTHLPKGKFDAVVLGCTHYIYLREKIASYYKCSVYDGNAGTVDHLGKILNICSKNDEKTEQNEPYFYGKSKKVNEKAYLVLKQS